MRIITIGTATTQKITVPMCACIGYFDGMHKGHQALIHKTVEMAAAKGCETALITFDPDPWVAIKGIEDVQHISTMQQRFNRAESFGIQNIVILKFTKEMSALTPEAFLKDILGKLTLQGLVCGFDFHYGKRGMGSIDTLRRDADFDIAVVDAVTDAEGKISSTRISNCITEGEMEKAADMLGCWFSIEGTVVHGRHQGTGMGFPTANIRYSSEYLLPKGGVYAGFILLDGVRYPAMVNLGHNPTFNFRTKMSLEAHMIDFEGDIYNRAVVCEFVSFMRPEQKFESRDHLIAQLHTDIENVRNLLKKYE